ncbi:MAG: glycosyl transferase family 2 [Gammaproteobacteria bacterium]|jgi:glycosyltransferase involved in cell wall biosynthesis|nr:glycosyl transferase family 2 [Gammaproteobacteria bacterium]
MAATLTVALIAFNEESNIARTLESVKDIADEIIVVDSYSTDKTCEIAESYGARVVKHAWSGFTEQKNFLFSLCSKDFILNLDCDEVVTPQLASELKEMLNQPQYAGYRIPMRTFYMGKLLKYAWYGDKFRLVKRSANPIWRGGEIHEKLYVNGEIGKLKNGLVHYSYQDIEDHFTRTVKYARLGAMKKFKAGNKFHYHSLLLNPAFAFIKSYFLQRGILDGLPGFVVACSSWLAAFLKYLFLYELENNNK